MKIYLDIDDVIFDWHHAYAVRFNCNVPRRWYKKTSRVMAERLKILLHEKNFWLNLPIKNVPNFQPSGFVSARAIPITWTRESLKLNKIPGRSCVNQVPWGESKIKLLKQLKCDIFIDDKYLTFQECHKNGIFCLLMDAPHNQQVKTPYRIYDLNIDTILNLWRKLK